MTEQLIKSPCKTCRRKCISCFSANDVNKAIDLLNELTDSKNGANIRAHINCIRWAKIDGDGREEK